MALRSKFFALALKPKSLALALQPVALALPPNSFALYLVALLTSLIEIPTKEESKVCKDIFIAALKLITLLFVNNQQFWFCLSSVSGIKLSTFLCKYLVTGEVLVIVDDTHLAADGLSLYQDGKLTRKCIQKLSFQRKRFVDILV